MTCVVMLAAVSSLRAENLNIDANATAGAVPGAGYAAAALPGVWNNWGCTTLPSAPLLDVNNNATDVTIERAGGGTYSSASLGYTGDVAALLNDICDSPTTITIRNLDPGLYDIYTYASDPDDPGLVFTNVTIDGITKPVGGPAVVGGLLVENLHYSRHSINHLGGPIVVTVASSVNPLGTYYNFNGIQIVPEPGSIGLLAVGALALIRRRR